MRAIATGTAIITATTVDGAKTATTTITVTTPFPGYYNIISNPLGEIIFYHIES